MRREYVEASNITEAKRKVLWAKKIAKIEYGYIAFEDYNDYLIWKKKKPVKK